MKAILVVDIDDSLIEGEDKFAVDGYLMQESDCAGCYEAVGVIKNEPLKPLPQRREYMNLVDFHPGFEKESEKVQSYISYAYDVNEAESLGWNECIGEIEGEGDIYVDG